MCVCVCFFRVCVLCASRSPGATEKSTQHEDELYIESAPLAEILSKCANFARRIPKNLHRLVNSPRNFPPKQLHNFKKTFRHYHATSPQTICTNLPTLPRDFPKDFYICCQLHDLGTFVCDSRRLVFHITFLA